METFNLFNKRKTIVEDNEFDDFIKKKPIHRKTNINSLSNIRIVDEEKLKKMERDDIMSHLGCFKLSEEEKSNNVYEEINQLIEKITLENLTIQGLKNDQKKVFNCFGKKELEDVDCRKANFLSNLYLHAQFSFFLIIGLSIFNLIAYYEMDYTIFYCDTALTYDDILGSLNDESTKLIIDEVAKLTPKLDIYKLYTTFNLLFNHFLMIISEILLVFVYSKHLQLMKSLNLVSNEDTFYSNDSFKSYFIEALLLFVTPILPINDYSFSYYVEPNLHITRNYKFNYLLISFALIVRLFFVLKFYILGSYFFGPRSQRFCKIYGVEQNFLYGFKCVLKTDPLKSILTILSLNMLIGAYIIRIFERSLYLVPNSNLNNIFNDIWLSFITITTSKIINTLVGYGDYVPLTAFGRIIVVIIVYLGVFILSMITVSMTDSFTFKGGQLKGYNMLNQIKAKENMTEIGTNLVQKCGFLIILGKKIKLNDKHFKKYNYQMQKTRQLVIKILKEIKVASEIFKTETDINYIDIIFDQLSYVKIQVEEIKRTVEKFSNEIDKSSDNNRELITIKNNLIIDN